MESFLEKLQNIVRDLSKIISQNIEQKIDELSFEDKADSTVRFIYLKFMSFYSLK